MTKHTPGPWLPSKFNPFLLLGADGDVAMVHGKTSAIQAANACLIAAAPDLLAALEHYAGPGDGSVGRPAYEVARNAIAKATGGTSIYRGGNDD